MADDPASWGAQPAGETPQAWGAVPAGDTQKSGALSELGQTATGMWPEIKRSTGEALASTRDLMLEKGWGGQRDTPNEGSLERFGKNAQGLLAAASVPFSPLQGVWRSLAGHALTAQDQAMRNLAVQIHGEDKVRAAERAAGYPEGGTTYEEGRQKADVLSSALMPGRRGVPIAAPHPPTTGPLGVTLSEGQETGALPAIRSEQAALRGQSGPNAERVAKEFMDQQSAETAAAKDQVARGLDPFNMNVAETPQEAGSLVSDAIQQEATSRKAGVKQAYDQANALPGEIHAGAFEGIAQKIKGDLSLRDDPIIVDDRTTPHANQALDDIEKTIDRLRIPNKADPFGEPNPENITGISLKGVEQVRKRLGSFRQSAWGNNASDGRAASAIVDAFDDQVEQAVKGGLFKGDPRAVNAWLDARAAHADYKKTFGGGKNDPVGNVVQKILGKNNNPAAIPNDVADFIYGSSGVNPNSLNLGVANRVRNILGAQSPEWSGVKQGLFSRLVEPSPGVTDWGPTKIAQRLNRFLSGDGKEMAEAMFSQAERNLMQQYADLQRHLEVPPTGVNRSETSTFVARTLRNIGSKIGMVVGAAVGHVVLPGMPWGVSEAIGAGASKVAGKAADIMQARKIAKQMPLVATRMKQYQKALAAANRSPMSRATIGIASANLMRSLEGMGISLPAMQGAVPAGAEQNNQQP